MQGLPTKIEGSIWILWPLKTHIVVQFVLFYTRGLSWFQMLKTEASIRTSFYYICLENTSCSSWKLIRKIQGRHCPQDDCCLWRDYQKSKVNTVSTSSLKTFLVHNVLCHAYIYMYIYMYVCRKSMFQISRLKSDFNIGRGIRQPCFFIKLCIILTKGKMRIIKLYSS